ncbi:hypothetical protein ACJD0Z_05465 [Flavobacteriaceae bacterium M23B6Z8]
MRSFIFLSTLAFLLVNQSTAQIFTKKNITRESLTNSDTYSGIVTESYANGKPKVWRELENGKAEGLWLEWYPNGTLRYRAYWQNGLGNGKWEYFHENGQLRVEGVYEKDLPQGLFKYYHPNGTKASEEVYVNGEKYGIFYQWDKNGILIDEQLFLKGERVLNKPVLFEPGNITSDTANEWDIAFTPDSETLYFTRRIPGGSSYIYKSELDDNGRWSIPEKTSFTRSAEGGVFITQDGRRMYTESPEMLPGNAQFQKSDFNIWYRIKKGKEWTNPYPVSGLINQVMQPEEEWPTNYEAGASTDKEGNLYYWSGSTSGKGSSIYSAELKKDGTFEKPKELAISLAHDGYDSGPVISPDGNYLFFASSGRSDGLGGEDIYYSKKVNGIWSNPKNLGPEINTSGNEGFPRFSPDGSYFFFSSDRDSKKAKPDEKIASIYYMETKYLLID